MNCPKCNSEYVYPDGSGYTCPMCHHFFTELCLEKEKVLDPFGNELTNGCDVMINEDLRIGKETIKKGTKVKNISLIEPKDGHDIEAKIKGFGSVYLKSSVVKKI